MSKFDDVMNAIKTALAGLFADPGEDQPGAEMEDAKPCKDDEAKTARAIPQPVLMQQIWDQVSALSASQSDETEYSEYWLSDLYFDDVGALFVVLVNDGKVYRAPITVDGPTATLGSPEQVTFDFKPTATTTEAEPETETVRGVHIARQTDGRYRWYGISGAAVLNRSGEIDTRALFDSMEAEFINQQARGEVVTRQFCHCGEAFRTGVVDWVAREGNFLLTSGVYDDTPLARAEVAARLANPDYWGDSIGFTAQADSVERVEVSDGITIPAYTSGILREVSTLPEKIAASHFTTQTVGQEIKRTMNKRAYEAFVKLWGDDEEAAKAWLAANPQAAERAVADAGMLTREADAGPDPEVEPVEREDMPADEAPMTELSDQLEIGEAELAQIAEAVSAMPYFKALEEASAALATRIGELETALADMQARMKPLEQTDEEKRERYRQDMPRPRKIVIETTRATQPQNTADAVEDRGAEALSKLPAYPMTKTRK